MMLQVFSLLLYLFSFRRISAKIKNTSLFHFLTEEACVIQRKTALFHKWKYPPTDDLHMINSICIFKCCTLLWSLFLIIFVSAVSGWNFGFLEAGGTVPSDFSRVRTSPSAYLVFHSVYSELHFSLHPSPFFSVSCVCFFYSFFPFPHLYWSTMWTRGLLRWTYNLSSQRSYFTS